MKHQWQYQQLMLRFNVLVFWCRSEVNTNTTKTASFLWLIHFIPPSAWQLRAICTCKSHWTAATSCTTATDSNVIQNHSGMLFVALPVLLLLLLCFFVRNLQQSRLVCSDHRCWCCPTCRSAHCSLSCCRPNWSEGERQTKVGMVPRQSH